MKAVLLFSALVRGVARHTGALGGVGLHRCALAVEGIVGRRGAGLQSSLDYAAEDWGGGADGACGEHFGRWWECSLGVSLTRRSWRAAWAEKSADEFGQSDRRLQPVNQLHERITWNTMYFTKSL